MPLVTTDLDQARLAYSALEMRAAAADQRISVLERAVAGARDGAPPSAPTGGVGVLLQRIADLEGQNQTLLARLDDATKAVAEIPIQRVVDSIGLAAAIAEASMPDRVIGALAASVTSHLRSNAGQLAARLPLPQLDGPSNSLSTVSFEVSRVPPTGEAAMPRSIFITLEEKQAIYGDARWAGIRQTAGVVLQVSIAMGSIGSWTWDSLLADVQRVAAAERALAAQLAGPLTAEYLAAADRAMSLIQALTGKPNPVAGDVWSISAALEETTRLARQLP
jgi:hypothetical protein